jgi:hypothetical protein
MMYAHQVIEDISIGRSIKANSEELIGIMADHILSSQQFFVKSDKHSVIQPDGMVTMLPDGHQNEIPTEVGKTFDGPVMPEDLTGVRMPYQKCFFSFLCQDINPLRFEHNVTNVTTIKTALLAIDSDTNDALVVSPFLFHPSLKRWQLSPYLGEVRLDSDFSQYQDQVRMVVLKELLGWSQIEKANIMVAISNTIALFLQTLKILSCKNITTIDNPPPEKLNKKRTKKGKCPLFTYKTLVIKPTGKKQTSQEAQGLWENRVHLCRGHFKTYTEENPLFGKFTGRYWWQPSVRGNKKKGVVMKDYKVEAA